MNDFKRLESLPVEPIFGTPGLITGLGSETHLIGPFIKDYADLSTPFSNPWNPYNFIAGDIVTDIFGFSINNSGTPFLQMRLSNLHSLITISIGPNSAAQKTLKGQIWRAHNHGFMALQNFSPDFWKHTTNPSPNGTAYLWFRLYSGFDFSEIT
jgi:hypothetical protein